jgi:MscS family membrane protein
MQLRLFFVCGAFLFGLSFLPAPVWGGEAPTKKEDAAKKDDAEKKAEPAKKAEAPAAEVMERSTPWKTMETFLTGMNNHKKGQRDGPGLDEAVACLDLEGAGIPPEQGREYAQKIKVILDKLWYVLPTDLPDQPDGGNAGKPFERELTRDGKSYGTVVISRLPNLEWKFSAGFLVQVPRMYSNVRKLSHASLGLWLEDKMPSSMRQVSFLLEHWQWLGLLILILVGVVLDRVVGWIVLFLVARWFRRLKATAAAEEVVGLQRPAGIAAMAVVWWVGLNWLNLPLSVHAFLGKLAALLLAGSCLWLVYRAVDVLAAWLGQAASKTETKMDDLLVPLMRKTLKIFVVVFGLVFIADNLGVNVTTLLAGVGIGGIAFALAAKDTVENLFGSVTVLLDRPFQIGDWVVIGDVEGTVEEVGFRSTRVRTFYNSLVTVPNSKLVNANVDNYGARFKRRIKMMLGLTYSTPAEKVEAFCEGVRELILLHPYTAKDFYLVHFNEFADSSLNILLYTFLITPDWATELRERQRLLLDIKRLAERLGVGFAFPTQTLHVETLAAPTPLAQPQQPAVPKAKEISEALELGRTEARALVKELVGLGNVPDRVKFPDPKERLNKAKGLRAGEANTGADDDAGGDGGGSGGGDGGGEG